MYFGKSFGPDIGTPVSVSIQQSDYSIQSDKTVDYNGAGRSQNYISVRKAAADRMAAEIRVAGLVVNGPLVNLAIDSLYKWVNYQ